MKKLFVFSAMAIFAVAYFTGCAQDPNSSIMLTKTSPPPAPAPNPQIAYVSSATHTVKRTVYQYWRLMVMNSDGTNQFSVFDGPDGAIGSLATIWSPVWSPDGKHISFVYDDGTRFTVSGGNYIARSVWTVDVNVTATTVTGSNAHRIFTQAANDEDMRACGYSPNGNELAVASMKIESDLNRTANIYTIPVSGGSGVLLRTQTASSAGSVISYSSDGSKIEVSIGPNDHGVATSGLTLYELDHVSGAVSQTLLADGSLSVGGEWSRTGADKFVLWGRPYGSNEANHIYTLDDNITATPQLLFDGYFGSWSPDNLKIVYRATTNTTSSVNVYTLSSGTTTTLVSDNATPNDYFYINWKR